MMRTSRRNSTISAYEAMEGPFDWNWTPITPLGGKSVIYTEPDKRPSWGPHARDNFNVGRALLHYRLKKNTCVIPTASPQPWERYTQRTAERQQFQRLI